MTRFQRKPLFIQALQWDETKESYLDFREFVNPMHMSFNKKKSKLFIILPTKIDKPSYLELHHGDWLIKDQENELSTCENDEFEKTYERVS